jgi:hypothetical protein
MTLAGNITTISTAGGNVTGITTSYDQDDTPESLQSAQCPALLHFPMGAAREEQTFGNHTWGIRHRIRVVLIYKASAQGRLEDNLGGIVTLIDSYISEMRADSTIPAFFRFDEYGEPGNIEFGGVKCHGCEFIVSVLDMYKA